MHPTLGHSIKLAHYSQIKEEIRSGHLLFYFALRAEGTRKGGPAEGWVKKCPVYRYSLTENNPSGIYTYLCLFIGLFI